MRLQSRQWKVLRQAVLIRDLYQCQIQMEGCTQRADAVDHIRSREMGGSDDPSNLQAACRSCNLRKGAGFFRDGAVPEMPVAGIPPLRGNF